MVREPRTTASPYTPPCWRCASTSSSFIVAQESCSFNHVDLSLEFAEWDPRLKHRRLQRGLRRATRHGPPAGGKKSFLLQVNNFFTWDLSQIWLKPDYNSQLYPLLDQAEEAQYCQWTTVAIQSQSCVFQKSKVAQVIHTLRFLCWASLSYNYMFHCSRSPRKASRKISKIPFKVLDAPELQDDFYLNLVRFNQTFWRKLNRLRKWITRWIGAVKMCWALALELVYIFGQPVQVRWLTFDIDDGKKGLES